MTTHVIFACDNCTNRLESYAPEAPLLALAYATAANDDLERNKTAYTAIRDDLCIFGQATYFRRDDGTVECLSPSEVFL